MSATDPDQTSENGPLYPCPRCATWCTTRQDLLAAHLRIEHDERTPCPVCGLTICDESKHVPTPRRDRPSDRMFMYPQVPADEVPGGVLDAEAEKRLSERLAALPGDRGSRGTHLPSDGETDLDWWENRGGPE